MPDSSAKVFICSTVYDFRDLRSALREWLEEFGYQVLVSERPDFPQSPDSNSYESCLDAIDKADYFMLFIGNRVGGWYDPLNRISITRAEYQHAHELSKQGKLKMLVFVRQEVWDIKEDRKALEKFLERDDAISSELPSDDKAKIIHHPSKFATHAQAIFEFVDEVKKAAEMKVAAPGAGPPGNWVYPFTSFKDVIDACKTVLNLSGNLRRKAIVANLLYELEYNLTELLSNHKGQGVPHSFWAKDAQDAFQGDLEGQTMLTHGAIKKLRFFVMLVKSLGRRLRTAALHDAITSGELLDYDKATGRYESGLLQNATVMLDEQITRLRSFDDGGVPQAWGTLLKQRPPSPESQGTLAVRNIDIGIGLTLRNCYDNIVGLSRAIHHHVCVDDGALHNYKPLPNSPFPDEVEKIQSDRLSRGELRQWLYPPEPTTNDDATKTP